MENETEKEIFAQRLRKLRTSKSIIQKELAEKIGVSANTIISYERAQKAPSLDIACKLALFFNVSLDWLSGISDKTDAELSATCDNVIRALVRLDSLAPLDIRRCECNSVDNYGHVYDSDCVFYLGNTTIEKFLADWRKMKDLLANESIDKDLYNLWLEKQISDKSGQPAFADAADTSDEIPPDYELPF